MAGSIGYQVQWVLGGTTNQPTGPVPKIDIFHKGDEYIIVNFNTTKAMNTVMGEI